MTTKPNPWIDRFEVDVSDAQLCTRIRVDAVPLLNLAKQPVEVAVRQLHKGFDAILVPTKQIRNGVRLLLGAARAHAIDCYPSALAFIQRLHRDHDLRVEGGSTKTPGTSDAPSLAPWPPICYSGLAGAGKSHLLRAVVRCLFPDAFIDIPHHARVPLVSHYLARVSAGLSLSKLLTPFMQREDRGINYRAGTICEAAPDEMFRCGICLLLLDELQFLTYTQTANAAVAKLLLHASKLGPPLAYVANYSLLHRLLRRPQEERQRLLSSFYVLEPDLAGSQDRTACLKEKLRVAPEFRGLDLDRDGKLINDYTFCINRLDTQLLSLAYRASRADGSKIVKRKHLDAAYCSIDYFPSRVDVELLIAQVQGIPAKEGRRPRLDLHCPVGAIKLLDVSTHPAAKEYEQRRAEAVITAGLSKATQEAVQSARQPEGSRQRSGKVVKFARPPATLEALIKGQKEFRRQ